MANLTAVSEMVATTIESRSKKMADSVASSNLILKTLQMSGNSKAVTGGTSILEEIAYAENLNVQAYSGAQLLKTGSNEQFGAAQFYLTNYAGAVTVTGDDTRTNSGPEQMIDLIAKRVDNNETTMRNRIVRDIYGDGTADGGLALKGLQVALPLANTTGVYGGIDRAALTKWQHQAIKTTTSGGAATSANILGYFNSMFTKTTWGGESVNIVMLDTLYWNLFGGALQAMQRVTEAGKGEAGFKTLSYQGVDIGFDQVDTGITPSTAYFLNTNFLKWRYHKDANFTTLPARSSVNQDASVTFMVASCQITSKGQRYQGVIQE